MLSAEQISQETGVNLRAVQYRLGLMRKAGKIKFDQFGQTYAYPPSVAKKVKTFDRRKY